MKKITLLFLIVFIGINVQAQKNDSKLYLKNGSVINCHLLEITTDSIFKIQTSDGSIMVYKADEVMKLSNDVSSNRIESEEPGEIKSGYLGMADLGVGLTLERPEMLYSVSTTHGYQFNRWLFAGAGTEMFFSNKGFQELSVYCATKITYLRKNTPYLMPKIGYYTQYRCFFTSSTIGYRFSISKKMVYNVAISLQQISLDNHDPVYSLLFKGGIEF